jgi:hypothetical protein
LKFSIPETQIYNFDEEFDSLVFKIKGVFVTLKGSEYVFVKDRIDGRIYYWVAFGKFKIPGTAIIGDIWMQGKKLIFNLKEDTITVYGNYNCTYVPISNQNHSLGQQIMSLFTDKPTLIGILVISLLLTSLLIIYRHTIKNLIAAWTTKHRNKGASTSAKLE